MMVVSTPMLASVMPGGGDTPVAQPATPDAALAFAAMMAGIGQPPAPASAGPVLPKDVAPSSGMAPDKDEPKGKAEAGDSAADPQLAALAGLSAMIAAPVAVSTPPSPASPSPAKAGSDLGAPPKSDVAPDAPAAVMPDASPPTPDHAVRVAAAFVATMAAGKPENAPPGAATPAPAAPIPGVDTAAPPPTTVQMLAARTVRPAARAESRSPAPVGRKAVRDDTDAEAAAVADIAATPSSVPAVAVPQSADVTKAAVASPADAAGQTLTAAAADRQLDLARGNAWLDGLARDISTTADATGTLRFQVAPQTLGTVHVEMTRGDDGAAVRLTASSDAARDLLADARPQLVAEARSHGIRINDTQIDVGGGQARPDHGPDQGSRDQTPTPASHRADPGATPQGGGGEAGRQSQPRAQHAAPQYQLRNPWPATAGRDDTGASTPATAPTDARYA